MRYFGVVAMGAMLCAAMGARAADVTGQAALNGKGAAQAVLYLEGEKKAAALTNAVIDQRGKAFIPHVLVVTVGTTVHFPNNDTVFHNVFAYFDAKKFDLGMYPRGATKQVAFDKKGVVALHCNVHSEMSAYIVVVDTPYYAVTDSRGQFRFKDVPPGKYTLYAWHESGAAFTQAITVKGGDAPLNIPLSRK